MTEANWGEFVETTYCGGAGGVRSNDGVTGPLPQSPLVFFPALSLALFFARAPLSERLEQAIINRYHAAPGPWYHAALLFSGLGSIVRLFVLLFSQQIREDLINGFLP